MTDLPNLAALIEDAICDSNCHADCDAYRGPNGTACASCEAQFIAGRLVASGYRREADVRREVAGSLGIPALHALRSIPDGEIRSGCVVMDGAQVRERLRQAYLDIQTPVDEPATALEPSLPLPVADGREVEQGQERGKEKEHG